MNSILLVGNWDALLANSATLLKSGVTLRWCTLKAYHPTLAAEHDLCVFALAAGDELLTPPSVPWLVWDVSGNPQVVTQAYQAGARAVFPREIPLETVVQFIEWTLTDLRRTGSAPRHDLPRKCQRGDVILLEAGTVIQIQNGVLATTMIHYDGAEVLLGLSGAGQMLVAHPYDNCYVQIVAHTDAFVSIQPWESAIRQPGFAEKLRARLQQMEGWAAMQARPYLDQRLLGILSLLAEQFGRPHEHGTLIDVRITHAQLASAIGATRTTVTRLLGELRATDKLLLLGAAGSKRYCLREKVEKHHY